MEYQGYDLTNPIIYNIVSYLFKENGEPLIKLTKFVSLVAEIFEDSEVSTYKKLFKILDVNNTEELDRDTLR
jgi:Ca2+-binding EF-hand superfamily protein